MNTPAADARWRPRLLAVVVACVTVHAALYATRWAGDAEIHLIYAENAANGRWFQFNPAQVTQGSTSALWTLLLASAWRVGGLVAASWAASLVCLVSYVTTTVLVWKLGERVASWRVGAVAALLFAVNPSIASNALFGMENCTAAALLVAAWLTLVTPQRRWSPWVWGVLVGAAFLCRPDAVIPIAAQSLYAAYLLKHSPERSRAPWVGACVLAGMLVVPFFVFQHSITGRWMPSSGVSRVLLSRRTAIHLGPLWIHVRLLVRIAGAYLPVFAGFVWTLTQRTLQTPARLALGGAVVVTLFLHTFIVGAAHASRYFLLSFPAFYILGAVGLGDIMRRIRSRRPTLVPVFLGGCVVWFALVNAADEHARLTSSMRGAPMEYHINLFRNRRAFTDDLLEKISWHSPRPLQLALTEVQFRGMVDQRITIRSLDGRVDQELLDVTPANGCPDYAAYFRRVHMDALHADQASDCPSSLLWALEQRNSAQSREPVVLDGITFQHTGHEGYWRILDLGIR
jgi:Dolichyl-phosphate-mannose-protein mannosyltransferase